MIPEALKEESNQKGIILHDGSIYTNFKGEHYLIRGEKYQLLGKNKVDIMTKLRVEGKLNEKDYSKINSSFFTDQKKIGKPEEQLKNSLIMQLSWLDFAENFVKHHGLFYDENKLWWLWEKNNYSWKMVDEVDVMNLCDEVIIDQTNTARASTKAEIIEALKRKGRLFAPKKPNKKWIQFKDKIIDLEKNTTFKATKDYFFSNPISWKIGESEETPILDKFFSEWVEEKHVMTLYEIIAFTLSQDYFINDAICLTGSGSNGKSTFLNILAKFVGEKNFASTNLEAIIKNRFESSRLYKKLVAFMGETNFNLLNDTSHFKQLTGEDPIGYEFKGKNPFTAFNTAKLVIATNTLPQTTDRTRGFYRRWLIIDFPNEFTNDRDILAEIPDEEYENLARKSTRILAELIKKRKFTHEGTIEEKEKAYEDKSNPLNSFISEKCVKDPAAKTALYALYDSFVTFLNQRRLRNHSKKEFAGLLREEGFETKNETVYREDNTHTRWTFVFGLRFNDEEILGDLKSQ